jgi:hypothetical protein
LTFATQFTSDKTARRSFNINHKNTMPILCPLANRGDRLHSANAIDDVVGGISSRGPGTLRKNVALVQKSSKTSVEQSFFAGCPICAPGTW